MKLRNNRKFFLATSVVLLSSIFAAFGKLESGDFANVMTAIGVAFMGGNAVEHWSKGKKGAADGGDA
jgi:hypothetical protein